MIVIMFQKNLVVWKREFEGAMYDGYQRFQKNLVVWKLHCFEKSLFPLIPVSEELSSVETSL